MKPPWCLFTFFLNIYQAYNCIHRQEFSTIAYDKLEEVISDEYTCIQEVSQLPNIPIPAAKLADKPSQPLGCSAVQYGDLNFEMLINMRAQHQTKQAATGMHTKKLKMDSSQEMTICGKIIHELHETLKEAQDDVTIGTGADRGRRWTDNHAPAPGGWNGVINGFMAPETAAGNAANAVLAAVAVANKVSTFVVIYHSWMILDQAAAHWKCVFTTAGVPNLTELSEARLSSLRPIQVEDYGILVIPSGMMVGWGKFPSFSGRFDIQ